MGKLIGDPLVIDGARIDPLVDGVTEQLRSLLRGEPFTVEYKHDQRAGWNGGVLAFTLFGVSFAWSVRATRVDVQRYSSDYMECLMVDGLSSTGERNQKWIDRGKGLNFEGIASGVYHKAKRLAAEKAATERWVANKDAFADVLSQFSGIHQASVSASSDPARPINLYLSSSQRSITAEQAVKAAAALRLLDEALSTGKETDNAR